jgi:hypothetical protein
MLSFEEKDIHYLVEIEKKEKNVYLVWQEIYLP